MWNEDLPKKSQYSHKDSLCMARIFMDQTLSWPTSYFFWELNFFLFFKIASWKFQHLFEKEFREASQSFNSFTVFRQFLFSIFLSVVWLSWNFVRFHEILFHSCFFKSDDENFSFLSWKTKKFSMNLKNIWSKQRSLNRPR